MMKTISNNILRKARLRRALLRRAIIGAMIAGTAAIPMAQASSMPVVQGMTLNPTLTVVAPVNNALAAVQQSPNAQTNLFYPDNYAGSVAAASTAATASTKTPPPVQNGSSPLTGVFQSMNTTLTTLKGTAASGQAAFAANIASSAPVIGSMYGTGYWGSASGKAQQVYWMPNNQIYYTNGELAGTYTGITNFGQYAGVKPSGYWGNYSGNLISINPQAGTSNPGINHGINKNPAVSQTAYDNFIIQHSPYEITATQVRRWHKRTLTNPYYYGFLGVAGYNGIMAVYLPNGSVVGSTDGGYWLYLNGIGYTQDGRSTGTLDQSNPNYVAP
jgi:hypothetical protein